MAEQRLIDANAILYIEAVDGDTFKGTGKLYARKKDIDALPTIEERKGKWIEDAETYYKAVNEKGGGVDENTPYFTEDYVACSECLTMFSVIDNCTEDFDFCPKCGASMVEGEEQS